MSNRIQELAKQAGFNKDKYQLYLDENSNTEGVDLEKFAKILISDILQHLTNIGQDYVREILEIHFSTNPVRQ